LKAFTLVYKSVTTAPGQVQKLKAKEATHKFISHEECFSKKAEALAGVTIAAISALLAVP